MLEQAGLSGDQKAQDVQYLINYFLLGKNIEQEPEDWPDKLAGIRKSLDWHPEKQPFGNVSAQVRLAAVMRVTSVCQECNRMILDATWQKVSQTVYK